MAVSTPRHRVPRRERRVLLARLGSAGLVASALGGLIAISPIQSAVDAAPAASSPLRVSWTGDASSAAAYQPIRDTSSPHYTEFDELAVTVSQTAGIIDQAIRVNVTGFAGTRSSNEFGANVMNYLQAMQCWGPDPLAADFVETCQWGGRYAPNNGLGNLVYFDNVLRVAPVDMDTAHPTTWDVPFRTVDGQEISGKNQLISGAPKYELLNFFSPATTNEVTSARIGDDGNGAFDFETQSSDQAPQLGCGSTGHLRCWLVLVPRGTVFGGDGEACSSILDPANGYEPYPYGRPNSVQGGSPVNPHCDYWDNRINVPLDFTPTGQTCPPGSPEERVIGSQLMVGAMSSWQPVLCQAIETTFSFSTNPDSVARAQLLERTANSPVVGYTGFPLSSGELGTQDERDLFAKTDMAYAPVAISGVVVAFNAEFSLGRQEQLVLSPRLLAKILTQSYVFTVPSNTSDRQKNYAHLPEFNRRYTLFNQDPEFQALNPNWRQFTLNPAIVLPGPAGADAIRQVWRWILADRDAVAFLNGQADGYGPGGVGGMTVNPYYLPKNDPNAKVPWYLDAQKNYIEDPVERLVGMTNLDGSPQRLSETVLDSFPRNDESVVPLRLGVEKTRFDSIQFAPFTENLVSGARQAFRADPNSKTVWDPNKLNAAGEIGDWISSGAQMPGQRFMIAITDSPSAHRYGLSVASLRVPNTTSAVAPDEAGMAAALSGLRATSLDAVKQVDPGAVPSNGYPLTVVTYAGVNMTKATEAQRTTATKMLIAVLLLGQDQGVQLGQLPVGYLPLTETLLNQGAAAAKLVNDYVLPQPTPTPSGYAQDDYDDSYEIPGEDGGLGGADPDVTPGADTIQEDRTAAASAEAVARSGLAISLGVGVAGFLVAPLLFRGRGLF